MGTPAPAGQDRRTTARARDALLTRASSVHTHPQRAPPWSLEVLGQYWANTSGQLRRHVALSGRLLELGRRFFRSCRARSGGFDSLPRTSAR
jgi:hypothetical protein